MIIKYFHPKLTLKRKSDGSYELKPERKGDLDRRKRKIDEAEQYALIATVNGWYECFNCASSNRIFLFVGEVWKYGVSKNGSKRYSKSWYQSSKLQYITQFKGLYSECFKSELDRIYEYPILPENLKRTEKLPRPPGNKEDY